MKKEVTAAEALAALKKAEEVMNRYAAHMAEMNRKGELKEGGYERFLAEHKEVMQTSEKLWHKIDEIEKGR